MNNATVNPLIGACVAPFLDASKFPNNEGSIPGRFCAIIHELPTTPTCCLPCPATEWIYPDNFKTYGAVAEWLNVIGLVLMSFMIISYSVLPASQTRSHYLSICLIVSIMSISIGFTIPLGARPEQCRNEITPNDMYSLTECAWSGAFIIAGGLAAAMWIFLRALSMNLQICWDIIPGRKFFYLSQLAGWGVPAIFFASVFTVTGVSFRFGSVCHVDHEDSMATFWAPLMVMAGAAGILQLMTFGYCIHVYLKNLFNNSPASSSNASNGGLPSYATSMRTQTARAVWQRLKKVLWLQWRGICIVTVILVDVVFFTITFVKLDSQGASIMEDWHKVEPWLACLAVTPHDKDRCLPLVSGWLVNESTAAAVLFLLSCAGMQAFLLLTRPTIFPAWGNYFKAKFTSKSEFVSLDARQEAIHAAPDQHTMRRRSDQRSTTFEMQANQPQILTMNLDSKRTMSPTITSPDEAYQSPLHHDRVSDEFSPVTLEKGRLPPEYAGRITPSPAIDSYGNAHGQRRTSDYFGSQPARVASSERRYFAPSSSFSAPMSPSRQSSVKSVSFESRDTYSRGGLGLNPPSEAGESVEELRPFGHIGAGQQR